MKTWLLLLVTLLAIAQFVAAVSSPAPPHLRHETAHQPAPVGDLLQETPAVPELVDADLSSAPMQIAVRYRRRASGE